MNHFGTEPVVHRGSNGVEPVRTKLVRTGPVCTKPAKIEPARTEPIKPVGHRGSNGPIRNEHMVPRTSISVNLYKPNHLNQEK